MLIGRLPLYALGVGGAPAVETLFARLRLELSTCMAMTGCREAAGLNRDVLCRVSNPV